LSGGGVRSLNRNRICPFSLLNREFTGKISIFSTETKFARPQPHESTTFYTKFPKKLTGKIISRTGNCFGRAGKISPNLILTDHPQAMPSYAYAAYWRK